MADTRRELSALQTLFADNTSGAITAQIGRDEIVSSHPSNAVQTAAYASEPSTGRVTGDLFIPSDGSWVERFDGSNWIPWGPIYPMTKPVSGGFAWINQGSAAIDTTYGPIYLSCVAGGGSFSTKIRKKSAPATPYTVTAAFSPVFDLTVSGFAFCGIGWRQSSDGKLIRVSAEMYAGGTGTSAFQIAKYTDATTFSANYASVTGTPSVRNLTFMRLSDDGTNRKIYLSADGQNWMQIHTVGRTDFITADEIMFFVDPYNAGVGMSLLSWKEA